MWSNIILTSKEDEFNPNSTSTSPPSRYKHSGVLVPSSNSSSNYDLYMYGGRSGTFPLKDFWKLDLKLGSWEEVKKVNAEDEWPPHLQEHSMVYYEGSIYLFGGEISLSYGEDLSPLWIYNLAQGSWRRWEGPAAVSNGDGEKNPWGKKSKGRDEGTTTKTPVGRRGHSATVWNNYMLIYGGYRDLKGSLGDLWAFHFDTESWHLFSSYELHKKSLKPWYMFSGPSSSAYPPPRHAHASVLHSNSNALYIHGGMSDLDELGDFWRFDLRSRSWTQIKGKFAPGPLHGHVGLLALDSLLILAGERGGRAVDEFWRYDFLSEIWERIVMNGCRPCPRVWAWGTILPMIYKRVKGRPPIGQGHEFMNMGPRAGSPEENKYWWDYDETLASHTEDSDDEEPGPKGQSQGQPSSSGQGQSQSTEKRSSLGLFSDFSRFVGNSDYQALSESNSVCLSEEEASPRPSAPGPRSQAHGLKIIEESAPMSVSPLPPLIDLGSEFSPSDSSNSPEEVEESLTFDPPPEYSAAIAKRTTRRSESANCLNKGAVNGNGGAFKKSASVRFADMVGGVGENGACSSSTAMMISRECTSDYSSMEQMGKIGFENPNYHGSGKIVEAYEMGRLNIGPEGSSSVPVKETAASSSTVEDPYYYQVSTPNYMLLIGGNESHSSQLEMAILIWNPDNSHSMTVIGICSSFINGIQVLHRKSAGSSAGIFRQLSFLSIVVRDMSPPPSRSPCNLIPNCKQGALRAVRYNVDGEYILTCGADRTIKLWNSEKSLFLSTYQGHSGDVLDVKGSCDNSQLASGGTDKNVFLWDVAGSRLVRRWRGHNSSVTAILFYENSQIIISGSQDNSVKLWDVRSSRGNQKEVQSLDEATDTITSLAVSSHSILVGSADGYTRLYDLRQGSLSSDCMPEAVTSVAISRDDASSLISVADGTIKLIDKESGECLANYRGHSEPRFKDYKIEVAFDFSDRFVLGGSPKGQIFVWDLISEHVESLCEPNPENANSNHPFTSLSAHPQQSLVAGSVSGGVYFFDLEGEWSAAAKTTAPSSAE